jgi:hypothetical protein
MGVSPVELQSPVGLLVILLILKGVPCLENRDTVIDLTQISGGQGFEPADLS